MAKRSKPRIRKIASAVPEQSLATGSHKQSRLRSLLKPVLVILQPLAPLGRVFKKLLGWIAPKYFVNSWRELRGVTWPGRRETWRLTVAVFVFAAVFGAAIYGVDKGLDEIFKRTVLK